MARRSQRIWITRAEPGASETAERVRALGHEPVVAPLLVVRPVTVDGVDLEGVAALAFTSANGVRAFAEVCADRSLRVFAVGAATAQVARAAGFKSVLSADGDVNSLTEGIVARRGELAGAVLHASAAKPAGDLAGALQAQGIEARRLVLYETTPTPAGELDLAALGGCDAVLLHSPRAAEVLARLLETHPAPGLRALGLSQAVIRPLMGTPLAERAFTPMPLEAALLNLIDRGA